MQGKQLPDGSTTHGNFNLVNGTRDKAQGSLDFMPEVVTREQFDLSDPSHYSITGDQFSYNVGNVQFTCQGNYWKCIGFFFDFYYVNGNEQISKRGELATLSSYFDLSRLDLVNQDLWSIEGVRFSYDLNGEMLRCDGLECIEMIN